MNNPTQNRTWILGILQLVAGAALALAIVLIPAVVATRSAQAQTYSVLYSFSGIPPDGANPVAGLVLDAQGNLYGTTLKGGASGAGTVFKVDPTGKETVLYSFTGAGGDGANPHADLVLDTQGNLYGTTSNGGTSGRGTVFKVDVTGKETVLYRFTGKKGDGANPNAGLVLDAQGNLYGTIHARGGANHGAVFKVDTAGNETLLHFFSGERNGDGADPYAGLVWDAKGNLYGTTAQGGHGCAPHGGCGTVFKVDTTGKETVLYSFSNRPDGAYPFAGLVLDAKGNLYGTTSRGGSSGDGKGTVFKLDTAGNETVLYFFYGGRKGDGAAPYAGLVLDAQGNLYGTTLTGGVSNYGTVFKVDPTGKETVLHRFTATPDGASPLAGLVLDAQGNLYGTTSAGGTSGNGTVFKLTP